MSSIGAAEAVLYVAAGAALGAAYFALLLRSVRLHAAGAGAGRVVPLYLARAALAVSAFWAVAQAGAWPLILALVGFLAARILMQRRVGAE